MDAVDLSAVGCAAVEPGERAGGGVSVGGGNLGAAPASAGGDVVVVGAGDRRIGECGGSDAVFTQHLDEVGRIGVDGGVDQGGDAGVEFWSGADVGVESERGGELVPPVATDWAAVDASDDFADEPAVGEGVVAVLLAGGPPGFLLGEGFAHCVPVEEVFHDERSSDGGHAGTVRHEPADGHVALAGLGELGPVLGDGGVEVESALLRRVGGRRRRPGPFGGGEDVDEGVAVPLAVVVGVVPAAPSRPRGRRRARR